MGFYKFTTCAFATLTFIGLGCMYHLSEQVNTLAQEKSELSYQLSLERLESYKDTVRHLVPEVQTIAVKNNNPCNIKGSGWQGQVGTDKHGHAVFSHPDYGFRAAAFVLKNYAKRHGIQTVERIVMRFCTGNQQSYIRYLCRALNVRPNETISITDRLPELLKAMSRFESGVDWPDRMFAHYDLLATL